MPVAGNRCFRGLDILADLPDGHVRSVDIDQEIIIALRQPDSVYDPLTEIARDGARRMLAAALRAEADTVVSQQAKEALRDGRQRVVRHGHAPDRSIQTGISALDIRSPTVRDRAADVADEKKIRFPLACGADGLPATCVQCRPMRLTAPRGHATVAPGPVLCCPAKASPA